MPNLSESELGPWTGGVTSTTPHRERGVILDSVRRAGEILGANPAPLRGEVVGTVSRVDGFRPFEADIDNAWVRAGLRALESAPDAGSAIQRGNWGTGPSRPPGVSPRVSRGSAVSADKVHVKYETRHAIGDVVRFDPEGNRKGEGIHATVEAVTFTVDKVLYDLTLSVRHGRELHRVDSIYVHDAEEV